MNSERVAQGSSMAVGIDDEGNPYIRVPGYVAVTLRREIFLELFDAMTTIAQALKKGR